MMYLKIKDFINKQGVAMGYQFIDNILSPVDAALAGQLQLPETKPIWC